MAVPGSGSQITLYGIKTELENNNYTAFPAVGYNTETVVSELLATHNINQNSTNKPSSNSWNNNGEYQAGSEFKFSDFYSYDHDAAPAFTDTKAVSKSLSTGTSNAIVFTDTDDTFNFTESDAFSISMWVKVGFNSTLGTNIHFLTGLKENANKQGEELIKIFYDQNNNRLSFRVQNKTSSNTLGWYRQGQWLFHSQGSQYVAGYNAAGLGSSYWSSSNRGNTGNDDYTMITFTKSTSTSASAFKLYWNATSVGTAPIQTNNGSSNLSSNPMSSTSNRVWAVGSNGKWATIDQVKTGNNTPTVYNDVTFWNKELSASEVTSLYNSGSPMNAETHSAESNLVGYWKWEGNGNATVSNDNFSILGSSAIVNK